MNRSESRYFATAARMDEAFLTLLAKKDFEYITIKEICEVAGVNRSTFYLHYETMSDLLSESDGRMNEQFLASMEKDSDAFSTKLRNCPRDELYLITPDYLTPYLSYIKNNKRLFRTATENAAVLGMDKSYDRMFRHVFTPILDRYGVLQQDRPYIMAFYIRGLMAIISEWLKNDCTDSITYVTGVIQQCVNRITGEMAVQILTGEADVSELAIQYDTAVTKMYNAANCEALGITVPDGYQPIE